MRVGVEFLELEKPFREYGTPTGHPKSPDAAFHTRARLFTELMVLHPELALFTGNLRLRNETHALPNATHLVSTDTHTLEVKLTLF